jgi:hypothetical protein
MAEDFEQPEIKSFQQILESLEHGFYVRESFWSRSVYPIQVTSFKVYAKNQLSMKVGEPILRFQEDSDQCNRNHCDRSCKAYSLNVTLPRTGELVMQCTKPNGCNCWCIGLGTVETMTCDLTLSDPNQPETEPLGKIVDWKSCFCSAFTWKILDSQGAVDLMITAKRCQLAWCCRFQCCNNVRFDIIEGDQNGPVVGKIARVNGSGVSITMAMSFKERCNEGFYWQADYPRHWSYKRVALLMSFIPFAELALYSECDKWE